MATADAFNERLALVERRAEESHEKVAMLGRRLTVMENAQIERFKILEIHTSKIQTEIAVARSNLKLILSILAFGMVVLQTGIQLVMQVIFP